MTKKSAISFIVGIAISVVALYFALKNVPFSDLVHYLTSINYLWVIPTILVAAVSFLVRVIRWQFILASAKKIGFWDAFHPLMISFMLNSILPLRAGEFARPAILMKNTGVPYTTGLATVAAERLFDVIIIIILFVATISFVHIDPNLNIEFGDLNLNKNILENLFLGMVLFCIIVLAGIIMVSINATRALIIRLINLIPALFFFTSPKFKEFLTNKVCTFLVNIVEKNITSGFALVKDPKKIMICIALSLITWIINIFSYYVMAFGCPGITMSIPECSAYVIIICLFIGLPAVPGYWGLWEAGGVFALTLFGISQKDAFGFTLANHAIQMLPCIIVGLISAVLTGTNIWQIQYEVGDKQS